MQTPVSFPTRASWIWSDQASRTYHNVVSFRCEFDVCEHVSNAAGNTADAIAPALHITADSRYEVFVNGTWIGHGPVRSWLSPWPVDPYDLSGLLRAGRNVIAVLVQHYGLSTFQYIHSNPGLLARLQWQDKNGRHDIVTGDSGRWQARANQAYLWPVPRLSCMQGWEEQFDARAFPGDWTQVDFSAADWPQAIATDKAGSGDHHHFVLRDIPQLTRDPVCAVRVRSVDAVRPAPYTWNLNPRAFISRTDMSANHIRGNLLLLTHIYSEQAQPIELHQPHGRPFLPWTLNGKPLAFSDHTLQQTDTGIAHARLKAGWNTLMGTLPQREHYWWAVLSAWTKKPVRWAARIDETDETKPDAWLAIGPFADTISRTTGLIDADAIPEGASLARFEKIRKRGTLARDEVVLPFVRKLSADMVATNDIYVLCASERIAPKIATRTENLSALLHDTSDWAVLHPATDRNGTAADVRILLDFGREVIGWHEFEIDAPAGTIIDNHNFEFIQPDGRHNLAEGMNNSFRYICREGVQRYRTVIRRGFQYSRFTFRNFNRPLRIRQIRLLSSTYPQQRLGSFACSDALLDKIWEAGAHSVACCSEDTYTDCPSYEQTFWVGDARNEALVDLVANGDPRLSEHCWRIVAESLAAQPFGGSQVPSGWEKSLPTWTILWMRWGQEHYQLTGDRAFASEMLEAYKQIIGEISRNISPRGLLKLDGWILFDWAPMDIPSGGEVTHLNCLTVLALRQAATLAADLGKHATALAKQWNELADSIANAINAHLWDSRKRAYIDCIRPDGTRSAVFSQQTHTAACIAQIPTPERAERVRSLMKKAPAGFVRAGSPFFMFFVLECLAREGRGKELTSLIRDYWGRQIQAGATTFWEMYHEDKPRMSRSHCHGWSAAPTYFLSANILGVQPESPGYATVRIAPQTGGLTFARGTVPTPHGTVEIFWQKPTPDRFELRVRLPANLPLNINLPEEFTPKATKLSILSGNVKRVPKDTDANAICLEGSGTFIHLSAESSARAK